MGSKGKKRRSGKQRPHGVTPRPTAEETVESAQIGVQPPQAAAQKERSKPKTPKPAPVLTRKPSRFRFFVDAFHELRKAHWPSRRETVRLSLLVATVCLVVGAILGAFDFVFSGLMRFLLF